MADQKKAPAYQGGEIFLLKMGEIVLKGLNRRKFEDRLTANISRRIHKYGRFRIYARQSTVYVEPLEASCDLERAWAAIQPVFGVAGLSRAKACEKDKDAFFETASTYLHDQLIAAKTFKVESKRADKSFPMTSIELSQYVGGMIHDAYPHLKVDVHDPEFTIHLEVRDFSGYVHGNPTPGAGGLPVGAGGRGVALLSGGIDSPVAAYMMAKRGLALDMVHFFSYPYTSLEAKEKVLELAKEITPYTGRLTVHIVPFTEVQEELRRNCPEPLFTLAMRRFMMRISEWWPSAPARAALSPAKAWARWPARPCRPWRSPRACAGCPSSARWWVWTRRRSFRSPGRSARSRLPSCPTRIAARCSRPAIPRPIPRWRSCWRRSRITTSRACAKRRLTASSGC